jgi:hypothetical protein
MFMGPVGLGVYMGWQEKTSVNTESVPFFSTNYFAIVREKMPFFSTHYLLAGDSHAGSSLINASWCEIEKIYYK